MNSLQYLIAQIGSRENRKQSLSMLLGESDLDGDWRKHATRSWRSGMFAKYTSADQRSRQAGLYVAMRWFVSDSLARGFLVEVLPFTSATDAESVVPTVRDRLKLFPGAKIVSEGLMTPYEIPGVSNALVWDLR